MLSTISRIRSLLVCFSAMMISFQKIAPLRRRKHILHRGNSPQIDVVFGLADRMSQPLGIPHGKSLAARGFYALYLRRFQYCSRFRLASCFLRSCLAQAGQYLARLDFARNGAPHSVHRFNPLGLVISACKAGAPGRTQSWNQVQHRE